MVELCAKLPGCAGPTVFPFGAKQINKVGIVTGSGGFALEACHASGIELLISGEPKHEHYHLAQELGLNAVFAGHYTSERFGVLALEQKLKMEFKIETVFIEESSGV